MLFNSSDFLVFFPLVTLVYFILPQRCKNFWLLLTSYYFYMCWNVKYVTLIFASTLVTWLCGLLIGRAGENGARRKKLWLILCLALNFGILFFFKYLNFFSDSLEGLASLLGATLSVPRLDLLLPVGISFYTFQALGYVIDVYRGDTKPETSFLTYALFVSFFPQLVAGPIERSGRLIHQLHEPHSFDRQRMLRGLELMAWGFFEKVVIADRIALTVNAVYANYQAYSGLQISIAAALFMVQLFCDFCGYSDIAVGAAQVLGFELTVNFKGPFFATTVSGYWRRWHISLTTWFRDYVYIPLGGNRGGKLKKYRNLVLTFGLSGLWHGADWTYVVWGVLNGVYQVAGEMTAKPRAVLREALRISPSSKALYVVQCLVSDALIAFSLMIFRAESLQQSIGMMGHGLSHFLIAPDKEATLMAEGAKGFLVMLFSTAVLLTVDYFRQKLDLRAMLAEKSVFIRYGVYLVMLFYILILGIYGPSYDAATFIYFQF